jgi:hypothetical protein
MYLSEAHSEEQSRFRPITIRYPYSYLSSHIPQKQLRLGIVLHSQVESKLSLGSFLSLFPNLTTLDHDSSLSFHTQC